MNFGPRNWSQNFQIQTCLNSWDQSQGLVSSKSAWSSWDWPLRPDENEPIADQRFNLLRSSSCLNSWDQSQGLVSSKSAWSSWDWPLRPDENEPIADQRFNLLRSSSERSRFKRMRDIQSMSCKFNRCFDLFQLAWRILEHRFAGVDEIMQ